MKVKITATIMKIIRLIILLPLLLLFVFLTVTCALWFSLTLTIWSFAVVALILLFLFPLKKIKRIRRLALVFWIVGTVVLFGIFLKYPAGELQQRMNSLHNTCFTQNPQDISLLDRITIWNGNIAMGLVAFPLLPEVAWETIRLSWPTPEEIVIHSDFAMKSIRVRQALKEFVKTLPESEKQVLIPEIKIAWDANDYIMAFNSSVLDAYYEARVALAVNCPFKIIGEATRNGNKWHLACRGSCYVKYPKLVHMTPILPLGGGKYLKVSEAMFYALQEIGWLHPFTVTYTWDVEDLNSSKLSDLEN